MIVDFLIKVCYNKYIKRKEVIIMITAREARQFMENAKEERKKIASTYLFSQFKIFESQIENWAKMGHNCITLRFQN